MDAVEMLKQDHERVQEMFRQFEGTTETDFSARQNIVEEFCRDLLIHATVEEEIFYPAIQERGGDQEKALIEHSMEEHASVEDLIFQCREMEPGDEDFDGTVRDIIENVQEHLTEEETDTFPRAQNILGPQLDQMGEQMASRKQELQEGDIFEIRQRSRAAHVTGG